MKRGKLKRIISIGLAFTMSLALLSGCGKKSDNADNIVNKVSQSSKDYVFAQEMLDVLGENQYGSRVMYNGDSCFVSTNGDGGKVDIYAFNPDGSDLRRTELKCSDGENYSYLTVDKDMNIYGVYFIYHWSDYEEEEPIILEPPIEEPSEGEADSSETAADGEGKEEDAAENKEDAASTEESTEEASDSDENAKKEAVSDEQQEDECYLVKYDWDGNVIWQVDLMKEFSDDDQYFSVNGLVVTDENDVILSASTGIYKYNETDGFKEFVKINPDEYKWYQLYKGFGGKIFTSSYGDNGKELCALDVNTGKLSEPFKSINGDTDYSFFGGDGYDLYVSKGDGVYGFDSTKDEITKLMDFVDSDIESTSSVDTLIGISDVEFVGLLPDADFNFYLARLTKIPPEQVVDKQIITIGGHYVNYNVRKQAFDFNKKNSKYKLKFVDYKEYDTEENYTAGIERMNMDIISGNTPDILVLSDDMPVDSYINKGLFCDMSSYLNNDPDIANVELLTNVLDALRTGDKLYQITPSFYIGTMAVKESMTDGKDVLSFKDCKDLLEKTGVKKDALFGIMTRDSFLQDGLRYSGTSYIDWANKSCSFNSDSFIEFLEFAKDFPESYPDDAWMDFKDTLWRDNEALFDIIELNNFRNYLYIKKVRFGEPVKFVGYPNDNGVNNSVIVPEVRLAISNQSQYKDACWDFIKTFLSAEYQDNLTYAFPIRKSSFEKMGEEATQKPYYMEGGKRIETDDIYYLNGQEVKVNPLTTEEVVDLSNFIKSVTMLCSTNQSVNNIINEEASAYFSGQKGAKEVADIIQSRLSIYVNENS